MKDFGNENIIVTIKRSLVKINRVDAGEDLMPQY